MFKKSIINKIGVWKRTGVISALVLIFVSTTLGIGMEPPREGELAKYVQDHTLQSRIDFANKLGNNRVNPGLLQKKLYELQNGKPLTEAQLATFPYNTGLPSKGSPKVLTLLIDFSDHPHYNDVSTFSFKLFGTGTSSEFPYESLKSYYLRSSYGALTIQGDILGWYRAQNPRSYYAADSETSNYTGVANLIKEALSSYTATVDFSKYDNNGDGKIDYFMVFWAGPDGGWSNIWWGWNDLSGSIFSGDSFTVSGKKLGVFTWAWECRPLNTVFNPHTSIHETGHAMGLQDYYDYTTTQGPNGGLGGLDMMDSNWGDHNGFSKWLLGWVTPSVVSMPDGFHNLTFRPASLYPDGAIVMPFASASSPFSEYFFVQNRSRFGNDTSYPNDGLIIWHVDARLNSSNNNFNYDNSYTSHKLLRLMEADGLEQIEQGNGGANSSDYYRQGNVFNPASKPNSNNYAGAATGVFVQNISSGSTTITADLAIQNHYSYGGKVLPVIGNSSTNFYWFINWYDVNGFSPVSTKTVTIDGTAYPLSLYDGTSSNGTYRVGPISGTSLGIGSTHTYYFNLGDNSGHNDRFPSSGTLSGPTVTIISSATNYDPYEPNDISRMAFSITSNNWVSATTAMINPAGDVDYYKIAVVSYTILTVQVDAVALNASSPMDSIVDILNSNGILITSNDDRVDGSSTDSFAVATLINAGTYYIRVRDYYPTLGGPTYNYRLSVSWGNNSMWDNTMGDFNTGSDTSYWAFQTVTDGTSIPTVDWLSTFNGHQGVLRLNYDTTNLSLKLTSIPRFTPMQYNNWYRFKITYYSETPLSGHDVMPILLDYANDSSWTIQELGGAYLGMGLVPINTWNTFEGCVHVRSTSAQIQFSFKNNQTAGHFYIDTIELQNMEPPAVTQPTPVTWAYGDFDVAADTTHWAIQNSPSGTNGLPGIDWTGSAFGQYGCLSAYFIQANTGYKLTSIDTFNVPSGKNAIMTSNIRINTNSPNNFIFQALMLGEKSFSAFDIGGYASIGFLPANTWISCTAVMTSQQTSYRLQFMFDNNNAQPMNVFLDDVQVAYYNGTSLSALIPKELIEP